MSLAEKAKTPPPMKVTSRCAVGVLLSQLSESESSALKTMLNGDLWTHKAIVQVLEEENYLIGQRSVERHRQGVCKCPKN
jgi:hypothetical protein